VKLMAHVQQFAGKPVIYVQWGKEAMFFEGKQPAQQSLITYELAGLKSFSDSAVREWLIEYHRKHKRKGEHTEIPEALWRRSVLDDILDAKNGDQFIWHVATAFTLAEISAFSIKHGPALIGEIKEAIALARKQRASALRKLQSRVDRVGGVIYNGTRRVPYDVNELEKEADRELVAKLGAFNAAKWIEVCASLQNDAVKIELLQTIGKQLVETRGDIGKALDRMVDHKLDRLYAPPLWEALSHHVSLPANLTGATLDLTNARETTVHGGWDIWKAKRVGPIKIGRAALLVVRGNELIYVRGERKLLHAIRERGGKITRWGCTLTVGVGKDTVQAKLLEVDRIDTLAQVDPKAAARLVGEALPDTHPITAALARAQVEPTWRRILADLLIERLVGIDADVARRLARTQAKANRRSGL
jgi:hypothetical protein